MAEFVSISRTTLHSCGYTPQIMMMIEKVSGIDFVKGHEITDLKPQFLADLVITMDIPSIAVAPCSTCSNMATPPPFSSSSSTTADDDDGNKYEDDDSECEDDGEEGVNDKDDNE
jgi:hypothetical protein